MAQNTEELNTEAVAPDVAEEEVLTSYTSESSASAESAPKKERPALTVSGSAVGRRKEAIARSVASALDMCSTLIGASVLLSRIVLCGKRLKCWNTMPIFWR